MHSKKKTALATSSAPPEEATAATDGVGRCFRTAAKAVPLEGSTDGSTGEDIETVNETRKNLGHTLNQEGYVMKKISESTARKGFKQDV
jgi:hypothetical protein